MNFTACKMVAFDNHSITRPTYFIQNAVTAPFQMITDTYGIPTYLEANPSIISMVTFPFMFGMMFGDMGHGSLYFALGAFLCLNFEKLNKNKGMRGLLWARYLLLLMGFMSVYCGLIYNEFFAINTNMFGTCYDMVNRSKIDGFANWIFLRKDFNCNYAIG